MGEGDGSLLVRAVMVEKGAVVAGCKREIQFGNRCPFGQGIVFPLAAFGNRSNLQPWLGRMEQGKGVLPVFQIGPCRFRQLVLNCTPVVIILGALQGSVGHTDEKAHEGNSLMRSHCQVGVLCPVGENLRQARHGGFAGQSDHRYPWVKGYVHKFSLMFFEMTKPIRSE